MTQLDLEAALKLLKGALHFAAPQNTDPCFGGPRSQHTSLESADAEAAVKLLHEQMTNLKVRRFLQLACR